jgi:hypothetical protein
MKHNILLTAGIFAAITALPAVATELVYTGDLNGSSEEPSNTSPGSGSVKVTIDTDHITMRVQESFSGLTANTTAAHIHCCTSTPDAGTAMVATATPTFPNFPSNVTSGSYDTTFNMTFATNYNSDFITAHGGTVSGAFAALVSGLDNGTAYSNIHTTAFPMGEIRAFLAPVPEPETYSMLLAGLAALSVFLRRNQV